MYISCFSEPKTKKLYLLLIYMILISIVSTIISEIRTGKYKAKIDYFSNNFTDSVSEIFVIVYYFLGKICYKDSTNILFGIKKFFIDNTVKDNIIFICVIIIYCFNNIYFLAKDDAFSVIDNSKKTLLLFILSLSNKIISDFRLYPHKIVGIIMCFTFSFFIDLCNYYLNKKPSFTVNIYSLSILNVLLSSVFYTYTKYLISNRLISLYIVVPFFD